MTRKTKLYKQSRRGSGNRTLQRLKKGRECRERLRNKLRERARLGLADFVENESQEIDNSVLVSWNEFGEHNIETTDVEVYRALEDNLSNFGEKTINSLKDFNKGNNLRSVKISKNCRVITDE